MNVPDVPDMLWSGWGDPARATPLPDTVTGLLRDLLGIELELVLQATHVHRDAGGLHAREDARERQLEVGVEFERVDLLEVRRERHGQLRDGERRFDERGVL